MIDADMLRGPWAPLSDVQRTRTLQAGARRLCHVVKPLTAQMRLRRARAVDLVGTWAWPGVLTIAETYGTPRRPLVISEPGRPEVLAPGGAWRDAAWSQAEAQLALQHFSAALPGQERLPFAYVTLADLLHAGGEATHGVAHWHWPGVQVVVDRYRDQVLAVSLPGQPAVLDPSRVPA